MTNKKLSGTFVMNRFEPIHRWYSYIEGYSSTLVEDELNKLYDRNIEAIYDPFGGTGTTLLSASRRNITPYYSETNPFMNYMTQTKINDVIDVAHDVKRIHSIENFRDKITSDIFLCDVISWDGFEKYYSKKALKEIVTIKTKIEKHNDFAVKDILMLTLSSVLVECSKMIRRGDLRFAKEREKKYTPSVIEAFVSKLDDVIYDIKEYGGSVKKKVTPLAEDSRNITQTDLVDCVITSPPYLNGTNYIRNTKLELKLNDYVVSEKDLACFHSKGIVAGINNVSKRNGKIECLPIVAPYIDKLKKVSYDKRIPLMVESYFYNMNQVFEKLHNIMRNKSVFIMDIGDSQFAGIHIPTHELLCSLCKNFGFSLFDEEILRIRHSKNGMKLTQRILRFELKK